MMKKMLRLGLVPLTALTLAAVVNAPVVRAEETTDLNTGLFSNPQENQQQPKTITVDLVSKAEDGTVLETITRELHLTPEPGEFGWSYSYKDRANHIAGYRLSHYNRHEVTYDEVQNGDRIVLEAIFKPINPDQLDEDALTFSIAAIDTNLKPLPVEPKTVVIYPGEIFYPNVTNSPVYPGYVFEREGLVRYTTYDMVKAAIEEDGSFSFGAIYSPVEPKEELKDKTITIVEERQDEGGQVIFKKEHVFNLKPHQEERLPLDQTLDQLIRGSNIASWDAYDDGAVIHFTTRRRPKADKPDTTLDDLKKDQQAPEVKPNPVPTPKPEDKPTPTPVSKDLSADRNKLLLSLDESKLTPEQKGKLAEKIAFAETEKDLADLKAELVKLVKAAEKPADKPVAGKPKVTSPSPETAAKSDKAVLPETGDMARYGLMASGVSLLLLGLGLAKVRKHD